jgi:hypothetical protein
MPSGDRLLWFVRDVNNRGDMIGFGFFGNNFLLTRKHHHGR